MFGFKSKTQNVNKETLEKEKKLDILCICGAGLGSSMVIEMTTEDVLKKMGLQANISHDTISAASSTTADIILTGENFRTQFEKFSIDSNKTVVVYLKNLTSKEEIADKIIPVLRIKGII